MIKASVRPTGHPGYTIRATLVPAGRDWDAVRVLAAVGVEVRKRLGAECGSVISDGRAMWFFVPPGYGRRLVMPGVTDLYLGHLRHRVLVPDAGVTSPPGPYWARIAEEHCTSAARLLHAVRECVR